MSELHTRSSTATRRQWLRLSMGLSAGLLTPLARAANAEKVDRLQWRDRVMVGLGTTLSFRAGHADGARVEAALDAAVASIRHVERQMSLFDPDSALSRLNRDGVLRNPHPDLVRVLRLAQRVSRNSGGAFDVTVQPLWLAWAAAQRDSRLPTRDELAAARARVGWQYLSVRSDVIRLARPGMALTLNGIAQGFAGDLAVNAMRTHGIEHALLDTGEWSMLGSSPEAGPWTLGVGNPRTGDTLIARLASDGRAIATSSDAHYRFGNDDAHHHIFDPQTGYSPRELASVTVLAPSCALADALTKVMFMGSAAHALTLARHWQVDVLAVEKSGRWRATAGLGASLRS